MPKKIIFVLYANDAPEAKFSSNKVEVDCERDCGRKCKDVKKDCIYPQKFKSFLENSFPEYNVKMDVRYQSYHNGHGGLDTCKDELRVDAELIKKDRPNFTQNFIKEVVIPEKISSNQKN